MYVTSNISLAEEIKACLRYYGPSDIDTLKARLEKRFVCASHGDIEASADSLVKRREIKLATGFDGKAYKV
jgi:hypothetical protein